MAAEANLGISKVRTEIMENLDKASVSQLKSYLKELGVSITGYRRSELVNLVRSSAETGLEKLEKITEHSFSTVKLRTVGDIVLFDPNQTGYWSDNLRTLPPVDISHCLMYAKDTCLWNVNRLINYQRDDGFRVFQAGFLNDVKISKADEFHVYVKALCTRETSLNEAPYKVWVLLATDGHIVAGHCFCPAGTSGTCKHVMALLFSLNGFHERHLDRGVETCTDTACKWDKPRKISKPELWDDIDLRLDTSTPAPKKPKIETYTPCVNIERGVNEKQLVKIIENSGLDPNDCMAYHILGSDSESDNDDQEQILTIPELVETGLIKEGNFVTDLQSYYSEEKCKSIEILTRGQSDNELWMKYRHGRVTSSIVHSVAHATEATITKKDNYILKKIKCDEQFSSAAAEFGKRHEDLARKQYENSMKRKHVDFKCEQAGFIINPSLPVLGGSPDGLTSCKCCGNGLLEIKCCFKYRNTHLEDFN